MIKEKSCGAVIYQIKAGKYYFLIEKMKMGHYSMPKGHVEKKKNELQTAYREIKEETNLNVKIDDSFREVITYSPYQDCIKDVVYFIGQVQSGTLKNQESEVQEIRFLPFDEAYNILTYSQDKKTLLRAYLFLICKNVKKMIIIGCPGSGKSYLSKYFKQCMHIPLYHLDQLYWYGNWQHISKEEFIEKQEEIMKNPKWIIDGHYNHTLENRIKNTEMIIYLKLRPSSCIKGVKYRIQHTSIREDMPSSCIETTLDPHFEDCIRHFNQNNDAQIQQLNQKYLKNILTILNKKMVREIVKYLHSLNMPKCS